MGADYVRIGLRDKVQIGGIVASAVATIIGALYGMFFLGWERYEARTMKMIDTERQAMKHELSLALSGVDDLRARMRRIEQRQLLLCAARPDICNALAPETILDMPQDGGR